MRPSFGAFFVAASRKTELLSELRSRGYVVASILRPPAPGRLRQAVEEAVESALAMRGAPPPSVSADVDGAASLRDQVVRARGLGSFGLALALPPLATLADTSGDAPALGPSDSAVLAVFNEAAQAGPVALVLDEGDRALRILAPVRLDELVADAAPTRRALPEHSRVVARPPLTPPAPPPEAEPSDVRPITTHESGPPEADATPERAPIGRLRGLKSGPRPTATTTPAADGAPRAFKSTPPPPMEATPPAEPAAPAPRPRTPSSPALDAVRDRDREPVRDREPEAAAAPAAKNAPAADTLPPPPPLPADLAPPSPPVNPSPVERVLSAAEWRAFAMDLDNARGPKPAGVIDRLFATRYMPLIGALSRGHADASVQRVVDGFRTAFEHSYTEGFAAIRATGKRPLMVLDAPDVAARIARLNNARAVRLLLVDALRFDLGERVMARLKPTLQGRAVCVDRTLLWSALPTTTPAQVALLGRGPEGLREPLPEPGPEPDIVRGRALSTIRRERYGTKEVFKLDLVEARLRGVGPGFDERLGSIADETAQVISRFVESSPPRTLLFVFGDHGFRLSCDARGTAPATQGGASPEEVLVPGYAWLVGGVH
ncbi:hypothetical protein [Polyangium jinanense]|uniref:Uncharacterized protein n=1 Tax=Polyangium jinanense TaxID=2829994 RepID=A0A9X3X1Z5_9BACT|nr:hypothetical protein [Polyangium jinanense]MDC3979976.1 hypothetical protein [Polyangium jinanense]